MKIFYKMSIVAGCLLSLGCASRIVYEDNYFPVPYAAKITPCPAPAFKVASLLPEKAAIDGLYVQTHIADDVAVQGYATCNATVIELYNAAAAEQNKKTLLLLPPEAVKTLSPEVKKVLIDNQ